MIENCFERLREQGRQIDQKIKTLSETWKTPYNVIGGYGSYSSESHAYATALRADLKTLMDEMTAEEELRAQSISQMDVFLDELKNSYKDIIHECDDIESVLMEYGYTQPQEINVNGANNESNADCSLIPSDVTDDLLEVEFTPDMTWRHKSKANTSKSTSLKETNSTFSNSFSPERTRTQVGIATPVIKSLASVMESYTPNKQNIARKCTPLKKCPEPPVFSSHFYDILKK